MARNKTLPWCHNCLMWGHYTDRCRLGRREEVIIFRPNATKKNGKSNLGTKPPPSR